MAFTLFKQISAVFSGDAKIWKHPKNWLAAVALAIVPTINCMLFTGSFWNPYGHLSRMKVAIINEDTGTTLAGTDYNLGKALEEKLIAGKTLGFTVYPSEKAARSDLDTSVIRGIFVIPADFSAQAVSGGGDAAAKIRLIVSQGQNAFAATVCETAGANIAASVNELLQEKRWTAVSALAPKLDSAFGGIRGAVGQLKEGAERLETGADQVADGSEKLASGIATAESGSTELASGAARLNEGTKALGAGLDAAQSGAKSLAAGTETLRSSVATNRLAPAALKTGTKQLADGSGQLADGITKLRDGSITVNAGAEALAGGTARLQGGLATLSVGATALEGGTAQLANGSRALANGLGTLYGKIPQSLALPLGKPEAMARGIVIEEEKIDPLVNNGNGFAPYFMSINLWIGILFTSFFFPYLAIARSATSAGQTARVCGKMIAPMILVTCQALLMVAGMAAFGVRFSHPAVATGLAVLGSWTFLFVVYALILLAADAGRLIAVLLTILQSSSAGGSFPVECLNGFYQTCHSFVPMRFTLDGFRYAISGAFAPDIALNALKLGITIMCAFCVMAIGRRHWKIVENDAVNSLIAF